MGSYPDGVEEAMEAINERDVEIEHLKTTLIAVNEKVTVSITKAKHFLQRYSKMSKSTS